MCACALEVDLGLAVVGIEEACEGLALLVAVREDALEVDAVGVLLVEGAQLHDEGPAVQRIENAAGEAEHVDQQRLRDLPANHLLLLARLDDRFHRSFVFHPNLPCTASLEPPIGQRRRPK
jgi:hypothetical protein